jgi:hypothetical protein
MFVLTGPPTGAAASAPIFVIAVKRAPSKSFAALPNEMAVLKSETRMIETRAKSLCSAKHAPVVIARLIGVTTIYVQFDCTKLA